MKTTFTVKILINLIFEKCYFLKMGLFFVKSYSFAHNCKEVAFWSLLENFHMVSTLISNNHLTVLHCDSQVRSCLATVSSYNKSKDEWIFRCESDITVATDWYAAIPHKKLDNAIKVPAKLKCSILNRT